jgi:outer membrane protein assembly factor BamD
MIFPHTFYINRIVSRFTYFTLLLLIAVIASGCASSKKINFDNLNTEAKLYEQAQKDIVRGNFAEALEKLQTMEKKYPFGEYSKAAQLALIYVYYGYDEPESAITSADRFIRLHPQHRNIDYAYYMKGLISFPKAKTIFQRSLNVDMSKRDISEARASFNHFSTLSKQFPNSEYTPDALKRMEFLRNLLAHHEIHVANYYFERKAYLAATNRGRYVVENFQRTPSVPDALAVMAQGYHEMKMDDLAEDSLKTLRDNYPDYPALNKDGSFDFSYIRRKNQSWLNTLSLGLLSSAKPPGFDNDELYNSQNND